MLTSRMNERREKEYNKKLRGYSEIHYINYREIENIYCSQYSQVVPVFLLV
jgi:hypothetical protein